MTLHKFATVNGRQIFYREAGDPGLPSLRSDPFFTQAGAEAFLADLPQAHLVWLDAGHFVLDENAPAVAAEIKASFATQ